MTDSFLRPSIGAWVVDTSWRVSGADGETIGTIDEVHPQFLVVGKGVLRHRERYVPVGAIATVEDECVYLHVASTEIDDLGWDRLPDIAGDDTGLYDPSSNATAPPAAAG